MDVQQWSLFRQLCFMIMGNKAKVMMSFSESSLNQSLRKCFSSKGSIYYYTDKLPEHWSLTVLWQASISQIGGLCVYTQTNIDWNYFHDQCLKHDRSCISHWTLHYSQMSYNMFDVLVFKLTCILLEWQQKKMKHNPKQLGLIYFLDPNAGVIRQQTGRSTSSRLYSKSCVNDFHRWQFARNLVIICALYSINRT